jgi:hypothetical protein
MNNKQSARWFYEGMREGMRAYAHWRDGVQYVGTTGTTLAQELERIDSEEKQALKVLEDAERLNHE